MTASARISWPLANSYLAVFVQDLMAADSFQGTPPPRYLAAMFQDPTWPCEVLAAVRQTSDSRTGGAWLECRL